MLDVDRSDEILDGEFVNLDEPAGAELVPVTPVHWSSKPAPRPDPTFVAQLIATADRADRKSTRLNSSHGYISYAVFCLKKKKARRGLEDNPAPLANLQFGLYIAQDKLRSHVPEESPGPSRDTFLLLAPRHPPNSMSQRH